MWKRLWPKASDPDDWRDPAPASEDPELREVFVRAGMRVAVVFALIFGLVYFAFWWSGAAVGFGADRASGRAKPTWEVSGTVRNASSREPVPWAVVEDDPNGRPPYFHTDASYSGEFQLHTLPESHRVTISAPGYHSVSIQVGRTWFLWLPNGRERMDVYLQPK